MDSSESRFTEAESSLLLGDSLSEYLTWLFLAALFAAMFWLIARWITVISVLAALVVFFFFVVPRFWEAHWGHASIAKGRLWKDKSERDNTTRYLIRFGRGKLRTSKEQWLALENGREYLIRYAANARWLVSAEPLEKQFQPVGAEMTTRFFKTDITSSEPLAHELADAHSYKKEVLGRRPSGTEVRGLLGVLILYRGMYPTVFLFVGSGAWILTRLTIFAVWSLAALALAFVLMGPTIVEMLSPSLIRVTGRVNKEVNPLPRAGRRCSIDIAGDSLDCPEGKWNEIIDGAIYEVDYLPKSRWLVSYRKIEE